MADVTLSKAVRSNLLNLQSTAELMGKTQERLATGLKVNSALDNPTNFFTASGLNSRAGDLGLLLDSVSNATQTLAAADKGLTAITKLVESAQATARQALQTTATLGGDAGVTATRTTANITSLTVAATGTATAATIPGGTFAAMDFTAAAATAGTATLTSANFTASTFGAGDTITFDINVDGGGNTAVTISAANVAAVGNADATIDDIQELADALNEAGTGLPGGVTAGVSGGNLVFTSGTTGTLSTVAISTVVANDTSTNGTVTTAGLDLATSAGGQAAGAAKTLTFSVTADGGAAQPVTIDLAAVQAVGDNDGIIDTVAELASIVDAQLGATVTVDGSGATLSLTSATTGASSALAITLTTATNVTNTSGIADASDAGAAAGTANAGTITINGQNIVLADGENGAAVIASFQAAATASAGTNAFTVTNASGVLTITGTGGNDLVIGGTAASLTAVGLTAGTVDGQAAVPGTVNPKRDELRVQYNELLSQIDDLAKDASFNGVNLLTGDTLSVLFNEDGSSKLDITGVTFNSAGLGLTPLAATAFDLNAGINSTLTSLKTGIEALRTQASKFGSNLSVVETRQNFTKEMINVLETGAANLTLADTNEEAANLLALQTRQQLSSTALSLASQADQQVLRLF